MITRTEWLAEEPPNWIWHHVVCKVLCPTCRGTGKEDCGCDGSNKNCFCKGTQRLVCSICGGSRKINV